MERTLDRTSYRRAVNKVEPDIKYEVMKKSNNKFTNMLLNQIIVSLLIIICMLLARYYEIDGVEKWLKSNIGEGPTISELFILLKNKYDNYMFAINNREENESGELNNQIEIIAESGNISDGISVEESGELVAVPSAVEGINQMSDDVKNIKENYSFIKPIEGVITSRFGTRVSNNSIVSSYHAGLDIAAEEGIDIKASQDGTVKLAELYSTYGNCVMIENGDITTVYAHCLSLDVKKGDKVKAGDVIAKVGMTGNATGPHLHFEIRYCGRFIDPELILKY